MILKHTKINTTDKQRITNHKSRTMKNVFVEFQQIALKLSYRFLLT